MTVTKRYTLIGSPTDTNGIITNTSSSNYIQTLTGLSSDYDVILKIKFNTTNQNIAIFSLSTASSNVCIYSDGTGYISWWNGWSSESSTTGSQCQITNNWVFVRLYYNSGTPKFAVKQSSEQETLTEALAGNWDIVNAYMYGVDPNEKWNIGYTPFNQWNLEGATVDLTNSSINGELFYEDVQPQPSSNLIKIGSSDISKLYLGSNELSKLYLGSNLIYDSTSTPSEPWYDWDLNTIGSNVVNRYGVYSGFNSSSYLEFKTSLPTSVNSLEFSFTFKTGTNTSYACVLGNSASNRNSIEACVYSQAFEIDISDGNDGWATMINTPSGSVSTNTNYKLDFSWNSGNNINATLTNLDNDTVYTFSAISGYTLSPSSVGFTGTQRIGADQGGSGAFDGGGTISLVDSYMKVDGVYVDCSLGVGPKPEKPADERDDSFTWPSARIVHNDVYSSPQFNWPNDTTFERFYKVVFDNASMSGSWGVVERPYNGIYQWGSMWWDSSWVPTADSGGFSDTRVSSFGPINPTSDIVYFRMTYDPATSTKTMSVSRDKANWDSVTVVQSLSSVSDCGITFMNNRSSSYPTSGCYIDTTESYIKIDNQYVVRPYTT